MWKKFAKDYLSFTKRDRAGIIVLAILIFIVVLLPYVWPAKKIKQADKQQIEQIKLQTAQLNNEVNVPALPDATNKSNYQSNEYSRKSYTTKKRVLFYFDPNTLDAAGWQRLGIGEKTSLTIEKYVSKGGKFKKPEDIGKIYGLHKDDYDQLLPFVKIANMPAAEKFEKKPDAIKDYSSNYKPVYTAKKTYPLKQIEINSTDTATLIALPGIGSKLAARIINFRDKLGGFYSVKQIGETYGLPDSTFSKIQSSLQCNSVLVHQFNINTADANTLKQHPYIRWNLANVIVQYRTQHGNFKSVDELQQITIITAEIFQKIKPYLAVQ